MRVTHPSFILLHCHPPFFTPPSLSPSSCRNKDELMDASALPSRATSFSSPSRTPGSPSGRSVSRDRFTDSASRTGGGYDLIEPPWTPGKGYGDSLGLEERRERLRSRGEGEGTLTPEPSTRGAARRLDLSASLDDTPK